MTTTTDPDFPYTLTVDTPFPTHRLASTACRALSVDQELSALVKRHFTVVSSRRDEPALSEAEAEAEAGAEDEQEQPSVLRTTYSARTNRMLRVAVNGFFESLAVVVQVMQELDTDVIALKGLEGLEKVQGVEQGLTGETVMGT